MLHREWGLAVTVKAQIV